ncbi:GNAT family N-acetyltransferase [Diaminobutyricibacter sp. McL0608]|uniref:GNAT family N-acetyltransferase n=1 Tax=Leifsonia sp. McL0608 TaxID=3143537 RepID=UPI0031F2F937
MTEFWSVPFAGEVVSAAEGMALFVNPELDEEARVTVLWSSIDGGASIALSPAIAKTIGIKRVDAISALTEAGVRSALMAAGIILHGADNLFYLLDSAKTALIAEADSPHVRRLTDADASHFNAFLDGASEQDLNDAQVELDHWAVFGAFGDDGALVSAASMYPWRDTMIADIGVLTLDSARGRGHARSVVRALYRHALGLGHEPQYRCQLDNTASVALARASGLSLFGRWEVVSPNHNEESDRDDTL